MYIQCKTLLCIVFLCGLCFTIASADEPVPVIYSSDLFHPHVDPDDHFDLALLFALPELDIQAMVFDLGPLPKERVAIAALQQMSHITGHAVPYATGLCQLLKSPDDTGLDQPTDAQHGVNLILDTLRKADRPVRIIQTGSLRDIAAAFNREPELLKDKVERLYINAGHSSGDEEYNVKLDVHAYVQIMRSGLPIYWGPCFGDEPCTTHWKFKHDSVLPFVPLSIQNFFVYALEQTPVAECNPIQALDREISADTQKRLWPLERHMWCTATFLHAAGLTAIRLEDGSWSTVPETNLTAKSGSLIPSPPIYTFVPEKILVHENGRTQIDREKGTVQINAFQRCQEPIYTDALLSIYRSKLEKL